MRGNEIEDEKARGVREREETVRREKGLRGGEEE